MALDSREFEDLLNALDQQVVEARAAAETRSRRDTLERNLKRARAQVEEIEKRLAELRRLGVSPRAPLDPLLAQLREEEKAAADELAKLPAPPPSAPPPAPSPSEIDPAIRAALSDLIAEMRQADLDKLSPDERRSLFDVWACRFRILCEKMGQSRASEDREVKIAFGIIKTRMEVDYPAENHPIEALNRYRPGDWPRALEHATRTFHLARDAERRRRDAEALFEELRAIPVRHVLPEDPEGTDLLRRTAKSLLPFAHVRDDLADFLEKYRGLLGPEFQFLWDATEPSEPLPPGRIRMTNRDIAQRILRRMLAKALIGACHGPLDRIYKGFPDHDQGRAKEALGLLVKAGIVRSKPSGIGQRVSIEPPHVGAAENFVKDGVGLGVRILDEWLTA